MKRTQIQLTEEQAEKLGVLADRLDLSKAEIIRRALDRELASSEVLDQDEVWERAFEAVGKYRSGTTTTSQEHDKAFADAGQG